MKKQNSLKVGMTYPTITARKLSGKERFLSLAIVVAVRTMQAARVGLRNRYSTRQSVEARWVCQSR